MSLFNALTLLTYLFWNCSLYKSETFLKYNVSHRYKWVEKLANFLCQNKPIWVIFGYDFFCVPLPHFFVPSTALFCTALFTETNLQNPTPLTFVPLKLKRRPNGADCKNFQSPVSPSWGLYLDWHLPQALRQAYDWGEKQPGSFSVGRSAADGPPVPAEKVRENPRAPLTCSAADGPPTVQKDIRTVQRFYSIQAVQGLFRSFLFY
jgi:hypothetical protein